MDTPWKERTRNEHSPIQSITYVQCQERSDEHESGSRIIHSPKTQERKNLLRLWPGQCPRLAGGFLGGWRSRQARAFYHAPPAQRAAPAALHRRDLLPLCLSSPLWRFFSWPFLRVP